MILVEIIWELKEVFNNFILFDVYVFLYFDIVKVGGFKNIDWNFLINKILLKLLKNIIIIYFNVELSVL